MKVVSGTVVGGKVEVPADAPAEADRVAILASDASQPIQLTPGQADELAAAVKDIRGGHYVDGGDLLVELRRRIGLESGPRAGQRPSRPLADRL